MTLIPNKIKFATSATTGTIKVGNFILGINDSITYGPTSVTGFYQGLSPVFSGYTVYQNKVSGGPSTFRPNNDSEFIGLAKALGGTNVTGVTDGLVYLNSQSSIIAVNRDYEDIITSGLTLNLDAGFTPSYPRSGTTLYDLSYSGNNGTLTNGPTYIPTNGGSIVFDGVDDIITVTDSNSLDIANNISVDCWFYPTSYRSDTYSINFLKKYNGTLDGNFQLYFAGTYTPNKIRVLATRGGVWGTVSPDSGVIPLNQWCNVVWTYSNGGRLYINGVSQGNPVGSGNLSTNTYNLQIGDDLIGNISTTKIYNREISPTEVLQNYQAQFPRFLGENIVSNGLLFYVDAGYGPSYPTTGTTWYDVSGYGRNGTLTNGPTYSSANGGSIVFDGTDDFCPTGAFALSSSTSSLSFNFWVKMSGSTSQNQFFLNKDGYGFPHITIGRVNNSDSLRFNFEEGPYVFTNYFSGTNNTWVNVQLVVTYGNATVRAYKNGVFYGTQISSTSPQNFPYTNTALNIGGLGYGGYVTGNMSIVQIYNKALSNSEVLQNYNAQKSRYGL